MVTAHIPYLNSEIVVSDTMSRGFVRLYVFPEVDGTGEYLFGLQVRVKGEFTSPEQQIEVAQNTGIGIAKAKFLLRAFKQGSTHTVDLDEEFGAPDETALNLDQVTGIIGRALCRVHDHRKTVHLDIAGVAHELGVDQELIETAVLRMYDAGNLDLMSAQYGVRLTRQGIDKFNATSIGIDTAVEIVTMGIANRLDALKPGLGHQLSNLQGAASSTSSSGRELRGYGNRVRGYFKEITETIYEAAGLEENPEDDTTETKVWAVSKLAGSQSRTDRTMALARSLERTAMSFNEVARKSNQRQPVEAHLIMVYVVLVLGELLDAAQL
ncbi:MAG: hypothetical protein QF357_06360 [Dehalococcoidia bacterium]|jgi:hypothetical protein|nr:hypothetical protein [Dehalococcoidia bacterium]